MALNGDAPVRRACLRHPDVVERLGIDHVGFGSDFNQSAQVIGWTDSSETFNVTRELVRRGYSEEEIAKIWSGNFLRVFAEVEAVSARLADL
jgi:membrane dipeptidase